LISGENAKKTRNGTNSGGKSGDPAWDMGDKLIDYVEFTVRLGLFVMNLAAITMGLLVLEA